MVKTLHPIGEISASLKLDDDRRVRLTREGKTANVHSDEPAASPVARVRRALDAPLDFPPLSAATVPGDRVAIAVDADVPCVGGVVRGAVEAFQGARIDPDAISIVTTDAEIGRRCRAEFAAQSAKLPQFVVHDPDDEDNLCLVGLTKRHEPLVVNRTIFDADVVLPIGCARGDAAGAYGGLFPNFSNAEAIGRYRTPVNVCSPDDVAKKSTKVDEAGWLIGVLMTLQVVPGTDDTVAHVVAGEPQAVARRCEQLYRELWMLRSPQQVSLVVANISGGAEAQNWQNVGRALAAVEPLLGEGGAVAICSNLKSPPGESLSRLLGSDDLEKTERKILRDHGEDSVPAWHLARALQRGPVYLLSQLDAETVEDLGFAPVGDVSELARLAGRHESCAVIDDSQHAMIIVEGDERL
ncbi:MAG: lactate racemase domain-containing protein [Planctomycetes bacterium]|nr:lactate racemase domain-containing protein [Planctomycetota bacterium]